MANPVKSFVGGASYPLRAIALFVRQPRLLKYLLMPLLINGAVGLVLYGSLLLPGWQAVGDLAQLINRWINAWESQLPTWLYWLSGIAWGVGWLLRSLLVLGLLGVIGFVLAQFGTLLGAPWYGQLSEQIERLQLGQLEILEVGIIRDVGRAVAFELKKLLVLVGVGLLFGLLGLIPGLGAGVGAVGGIGLAALLVCLDFLDAPLERRRLRFRHKLGLVLRYLPGTASFSLVCLVLMGIPLLNLVMVPVCVGAGTLFFCDRIWPQQFAARLVPEPGAGLPPLDAAQEAP